MKKRIALFLVFVMAITTVMVPMDFSFAENKNETNYNYKEQEEVESDVNESETNTEESQTEETVPATDSKTTDESIKEETKENGSKNNEGEIEENIQEDMSFLYIDNKVLEAPGTQNIVVSWEEDLNEVENITLIYENSKGDSFSINEDKRTDASVLFTKEFAADEVEFYTIKGVKYFIGDEEYYFEFDNVEIDATFEVIKKASEDESIVTVEVEKDGDIDKKEINSQMKAAVLSSDVNAVSSRSASKSGNLVVVLDPGHGGSDSGATRGSVYEKNLNLKVAQYCKAELEEYSGVTVYMTRTGDSSLELDDRAQIAKNYDADILVSIHQNSGSSSATGAEVYYPNRNYNTSASDTGKKTADSILAELSKLGLKNRGSKIRNTENGSKYPNGSPSDYYGIIRESKLRGISAIIVEHAFLSNASDYNKYLSSDSKLKQLGVADATGIAKAFGLSKKTGIELDTKNYMGNVGDVYQFLAKIYNLNGTPKVYSENPDIASVKLKNASDSRGRLYEIECLREGTTSIFVELGGYVASFPVKVSKFDYKLDTSKYTMEIGGSYQFLALIKNKKGTPEVKSSDESIVKVKLVNANDSRGYLYQIDGVGAGKATISVDYRGVVKTLDVTVKNLYAITGKTKYNINDFINLYVSNGKTYPSYYSDSDAPTLNRFCEIYIEEAEKEGVKAEVAFCQAMYETGWLAFGGQVDIKQFNFAGLGATDGGASGASFPDVRTGIRAHIQHLKAYANNEPLKNVCVDPRFDLVKRGSAQYVEWLGQKENPYGYGWATSPEYGYKILKLINNL